MATTRSLMEEIGQSPVSLNRECPGFALNRIQYACINEAWNMYQVNLITLLNHFAISSLLFQPKQYLLTNQGYKQSQNFTSSSFQTLPAQLFQAFSLKVKVDHTLIDHLHISNLILKLYDFTYFDRCYYPLMQA
jgi:hypothetical protein